MAKNESDFKKLLSEAPMSPNQDTITVVGMLARTPDAAHFMLRLPDGRSFTLDVDAVKSANAMAGAIGQSIVQLELDAKRIPESVMQSLYKSGPDHTAISLDTQFGPFGTSTFLDVGHGGFTAKEVIETSVVDPAAGVAPYVAAMPHHASHTTMSALAHSGIRTYFSATDWTTDHHAVVKPRLDQP
jgi:hypothetical protein